MKKPNWMSHFKLSKRDKSEADYEGVRHLEKIKVMRRRR